MHLIFNMFAFYFFGRHVDRLSNIISLLAECYLLFFYLLSAAVSALPSISKHKNNQYYNSVGASGAVSAIVFASILFGPLNDLGLILIPGLRIPGFIFGFLYIIYSHFMSKRNADEINHDAHLTGAIFGFFIPNYLKTKTMEFVYW
jgi:membrane associated rhomboid family serine protease